MAHEVVMPKLGATMEQGKVLQWYKAVGDVVVKGEPILEIMTDKINIDVEAEADGVLLKTLYDADEDVPVNTVIAYIGATGENIDSNTKAQLSELDTVNRPAPSPNATRHEATSAQAVTGFSGRVRATPAARRLARENNIALNELAGRGPLGRIQKADVVEAIKHQADQPTAGRDQEQTAEPATVGQPARDTAVVQKYLPSIDVSHHVRDGDTRIKVEGIRKIVGQRMAVSAQTIPHVTLTCDVIMDECVKLRERLLPVIEKHHSVRLSMTHILIFAVARTLRRYPRINSTFSDQEMILHQQVNVGMAVAISDGLVVPVVHDAARKGLEEVAVECHRLTHLARERRLGPDDMTGGTFTVSNLGAYRVDAFTPIINPGESAILGVGRIIEKPVVVNGALSVARVMTVSFSFDHRAVDGAPAAAFLTELAQTIENPEQLLL